MKENLFSDSGTTETTQNANITVDKCMLFPVLLYLYKTHFTHITSSVRGWLSTTTHSQVVWIKVPER